MTAPSNNASNLSRAGKRRGLIALLIGNFLMWCGFFIVIPLISVHYVKDLHWQAASIGLILAVRQLTQQGLTLFGGVLADRIGARGLICVGMLVRAAGFAGMAIADTFTLLMLAAILAALGGALFESPRAAAIAALTDESDRARYYSLSGVVGNLGMTLGPLIGAWLIAFNFGMVAMVAAGIFVLAFFVSWAMLPPLQLTSERHGLWDGIGLAIRDRSFMLFNVFLMGYWFMWVQLTISLPLIGEEISGTTDAVSWIYTLNAGMSFLLQYPLLMLAERWLRPLPILIFGMVLMALGLGAIALSDSIFALLICVAIFSIGALLATPSQQTVAASMANPQALGSYFGVNSLALALGGGLGNYCGGLFYGMGEQYAMPALPWLIFAALGACAALGLLWLRQAQQQQAAAALVL